jgi:hypothetical protein
VRVIDFEIEDVYVNATEGRMVVLITPNINTTLSGIDGDEIIVTNNGTPLTLRHLGSRSGMEDISMEYSFTPITSGNLDFDVTYNPVQGTKDWAFDNVTGPLTFTGDVQYMPGITMQNITAEYNSSTHEIKLTFSPELKINGKSANCAFTLNINNTVYQLRGWRNHYDDNVYYVAVGEEIPRELMNGTITISYAPHDERIEDFAHAEISDFGPIPVMIP